MNTNIPEATKQHDSSCNCPACTAIKAYLSLEPSQIAEKHDSMCHCARCEAMWEMRYQSRKQADL